MGANGCEHREELERRRQWLLTRVSPPRCLSCGSSDIIPVPHGRIAHPEQEGWIDVEVLGWADPCYEWFFTPEGERLRMRGRSRGTMRLGGTDVSSCADAEMQRFRSTTG